MACISNTQNDSLLNEESVKTIFKNINLSTPSTTRFKIISNTGEEILAKIHQLFQDKLNLFIDRKASLFSIEGNNIITFALLKETPAHVKEYYSRLKESLISEKRRKISIPTPPPLSSRTDHIDTPFTIAYESQKGLRKSTSYALCFARSKAYHGKVDTIAHHYAAAYEAQKRLGKLDSYASAFAASEAYHDQTDAIAHHYAQAFESQHMIGKSPSYAECFARSKVYHGHDDETASIFSSIICSA